MRRILLLYILFSVVGLSAIHAQLNPARQQIDENGRDQYGNQVDPAMIPDKLDSANVEVQDCHLHSTCGALKINWATGQ